MIIIHNIIDVLVYALGLCVCLSAHNFLPLIESVRSLIKHKRFAIKFRNLHKSDPLLV